MEVDDRDDVPAAVRDAERPVARRGMLGKVVAGAAGAVAASALLDSNTAHAAPNFELNINNASTTNTNVSGPGGNLPWFGPSIGLPVVLSVECTSGANNAFAARGRDIDDSYGVYGAASYGVVGVTSASSGISSEPSRGVWGLGAVDGTHGVVAQFRGDVNAAGAPLRIADAASSAVAPTGGNHLAGELTMRSGNLWLCVVDGVPGTWVRLAGPTTRGSDIRFLDAAPTANGTAPTAGAFVAGEAFASAGLVWLCTASGTPGTWVNLNPPAPTPPTGNVTTIVPGRVLDTRGAAQITTDVERVLSVATSTTNVPLVPANATGVFYNLTVTQTVAAGWLAVYPAGSTWPGTSAVNWSAPDATIANSGVSALGPDRSIIIRGGPGAAHAVVDVTGYIV